MPTKSSREKSLSQRVRAICRELAKGGWGELFKAHGLDILAKDLESELLRPLPAIDRGLDGFQDFSLEGVRGIEPGRPALSLLFHALASPQVTTCADGAPLGKFPKSDEIETVEDYVYGIRPPSIQELRARVKEAPLAVVVFATEYRPAIGTVHQRHADFCFSRAGVSRVGTQPAKYVPEARGYLPDADDPHEVRVLPCRFSAYLAAQLPGDSQSFGPMRFQEPRTVSREVDGRTVTATYQGDGERLFWVPIHKLFPGKECIRGRDLTLGFQGQHLNEKLNRVHKALMAEGFNTGSHQPVLAEFPFQIRENLAEFSTDASDGAGLLVPVVHEHLVARAYVGKKLLTYRVPPKREPFRSSVNIPPRRTGARAAPEYVHARERVGKDGVIEDLNGRPNVADIVQAGEYDAVHFIDHTADGYVEAVCPELAFDVPHNLPAYSLVAAVDYFPHVKQQELMQWWRQSVPPELIASIWPENPGPPLTLSDTRYPANLSLTLDKLNVENKPRSVFDPSDDSISAIVAPLDSGAGRLTRIDPLKNRRASWLPDAAAGVFAPGWDSSIDRTDERDPNDDGAVLVPGTTFLNNYGLGSPFPEDSMLCAALSAFWPAAAPDITRTFAPGRYATTTPLTDEVLGIGSGEPWDGIPGPRIPDPAKKEVAYRAIEYGDYVQASLRKQFNFHVIGGMTFEEYGARTVVMARVYQVQNALTRADKRKWAVYSFRHSLSADADRQAAETSAGVKLNSQYAYRLEMFEHREARPHPTDHRLLLVPFDEMLVFHADPHTVLRREMDGSWKAFRY